MKKLFTSRLKKFNQSVFNIQQITLPNLTQIISKFKLYQYSQLIYYRFPRQDFKRLINIPCPINNPQQQQQIIRASKRLRFHLNISEKKICQSCKLKQKCQLFQINQLQKKQGAVPDLVIWLSSLNSKQNREYSYKIWDSGVKIIDTFGQIVDDLKKGGDEMKIYNDQRLRQSNERLKRLQGKQVNIKFENDEMKKEGQMQKREKKGERGQKMKIQNVIRSENIQPKHKINSKKFKQYNHKYPDQNNQQDQKIFFSQINHSLPQYNTQTIISDKNSNSKIDSKNIHSLNNLSKGRKIKKYHP